MTESLRTDAQFILATLTSTPFEDCYPLSRSFEPVPTNAGFYAFRHLHELLYIGVGNNLRRRFRNGHKALSWAFVDRLNPESVRIATFAMGLRSPQQVEYIETMMIQIARPPYNARMK